MLVALMPIRPAGAEEKRDYSELERVALAELKEKNTPGAAIAVVSGDQAVFLKGFGVTSVEEGMAVTPDTLFYNGGLSRLFTAAVLVSLSEEGKVDLHAPIGKYVKGLSPGLSRVTAHQLLVSTAGIKEQHLTRALTDETALSEIVRRWGDDRIFAEPGKIFSSSHPSYALAGLLIEELAKKPFADMVRDRVFTPVGMSRSTYRPLVAVTYPFSQGHTSEGAEKPKVYRPLAENSVGWPRNSFTSVRDASRFLIALINEGKLDGHQALAPTVIAKLLKPYAVNPSAIGEEQGYGLSFSIDGDHRSLSSNTGWGGISVTVQIVPDERFAMIILANGDRRLSKTGEKAFQMFIPGHKQAAPNSAPPITMTQSEMVSYAGVYENERVLRLSVKNGTLFVRDETPIAALGSNTDSADWPVTKTGDHYFAATPPDPGRSFKFALIADKDGKVLYLHYGGRALRRR